MKIEIRKLVAEEMGLLGELGAYVYGGSFGDGPDNIIATANEPDWTLCAFVDGKLASSFTSIPFTMRANGRAIPMAGVSTVGTQTEFRRRGLSRRIHTQAFAEMRNQGQTVASLWASQAAIYQRYGYAMVTAQRNYEIDSIDINFFDGNFGSGEVVRKSVEDGYDEAKALYIEFISDRMCYLHRAKSLWLQNVFEERTDDGPVHLAICYDANANANGYIAYTLRHSKVAHGSRPQGIEIRDFVWNSPDAYRSLWEWLRRHDLVGRIRYGSAPMDDPAPLLFTEPRLLHTTDREGLWMRVVDVPAALSSRAYIYEDEITIGLPEDSLTPWNKGNWQLHTTSEKAEAHPTKKSPDISLSINSLALLYTGYLSASRLASLGLLSGAPRALEKADRLFTTHHAPHCPDHF